MKKMHLTAVKSQTVRNIRFAEKLALILCFAMIAVSVGAFLPSGSEKSVYAATTEEKIANARKKKADAQKQIDQIKKNVKALSGETGQLKDDLTDLSNLSTQQKKQYEEIAGELEAALKAKQEALDMFLSSQATLDTKKAEYSERMSVMFEYQNKSPLEILLESDSIAGFFTNLELITLVGDSDTQIMEELKAAMDDAQLKSDYAQKQSADMQAVADAKQAELDELAARIGKTKDALEEKQAALSDWQKKEDSLDAASKKLDEEIAALQKKLSGGGGGGTTNPPPKGSMTWPYPGDYTVYSGFGMRFHPIYHIYKMHYGVDLGGSYGNPIVAASDGTVIIASAPVAGQNTGGTNYGNYIVIDHGGGVSTAYAHCRNLYVSVGDKVKAGQKIAACGSTGASTGPHLHFEVRINGTKVNPVPYIT